MHQAAPSTVQQRNCTPGRVQLHQAAPFIVQQRNCTPGTVQLHRAAHPQEGNETVQKVLYNYIRQHHPPSVQKRNCAKIAVRWCFILML